MYSNKRCTVCKKKAVYIIVNDYGSPDCDDDCAIKDVILCKEHAPKLSNGEFGYTKLTIKKIPFNCPKHIEDFEKDLPMAPRDRCYVCGKKIDDHSKFIHQKIKNIMQEEKRVLPALPIQEIEYWVCKDGDDCL